MSTMLKDIVVRAYRFAEEKHKGQVRRFTDLPYFTHPKYVARIVEDLNVAPELVAAALLHDVVEDTNTSMSEIHDHFGSIVAMIVHELTNDVNDPLLKENKGLYLAQKMVDISPGALLIKLADRYHNVSFLKSDDVSKEFREKYIRETQFILEYIVKNRTLMSSAHMDLINNISEEIDILVEKYVKV